MYLPLYCGEWELPSTSKSPPSLKVIARIRHVLGEGADPHSTKRRPAESCAELVPVCMKTVNVCNECSLVSVSCDISYQGITTVSTLAQLLNFQPGLLVVPRCMLYWLLLDELIARKVVTCCTGTALFSPLTYLIFLLLCCGLRCSWMRKRTTERIESVFFDIGGEKLWAKLRQSGLIPAVTATTNGCSDWTK